MSFLDQTGLGTFWAKLKNYFVHKVDTEAPVTGLTDILTPVNLMPNSDFSRSGNIASPITIGQSSELVQQTIAHGVSIIFQFGTTGRFSNVTVTRSSNNITVSGTASGAQYFYFLCGTPIAKEMNKVFTIGAKITSATNITSVNSQGTNIGSKTYIYKKFLTDNELGNTVSVFSTLASQGAYSPCVIDVGDGEFSVTISGFFLYEGEFKDPPLKESLDAWNNKQFPLISDSFASGYKSLNDFHVFYYYPANGAVELQRLKHFDAESNLAAGKHVKYHLLSFGLTNGQVFKFWGNVVSSALSGQSSTLYNNFGFYYYSYRSVNTNAGIRQKWDIDIDRSSTYCPIAFTVSIDSSQRYHIYLEIDTTNLSQFQYKTFITASFINNANDFTFLPEEYVVIS